MAASKAINDLSNPEHPLVADAPRQCHNCGAALCLRKQVINLALGNDEEMLCLNCLGSDSRQKPAEVLSRLAEYIARRPCFSKEWARYENVDYCPDRGGCLPEVCFEQRANDERTETA